MPEFPSFPAAAHPEVKSSETGHSVEHRSQDFVQLLETEQRHPLQSAPSNPTAFSPEEFKAATPTPEMSIARSLPPRGALVEHMPESKQHPAVEEREGGAVFLPGELTAAAVPQSTTSVAMRLDRRGNDVEATIRETRWAVDFWKSQSPEQIEPLLDHVTGLLNRIEQYKAVSPQILSRLPERERTRFNDEFGKASVLRELLDDWAEDFDGMKLCEILADKDFGIKGSVDLLTNLLGITDRSFARPLRYHSLFEHRGRQTVPHEQRRDESISSRHAGITDSFNRTRSMENLFSSDIFHFKGLTQRIPESPTVQQFSASGAPFIGGASGTIEQIIAMMEHDRPASTLPFQEKEQREQVIALYSAMQVAGGHHSLMEAMMPARAYGYLAELPNGLTSPTHYQESMNKITTRFVVSEAGDEAP